MSDSKSQWTPGPWRYQPIPGYQYVLSTDAPAGMALIASGIPLGREAEVRANLQCASAAPDLYAALERATADLKKTQYVYGGDFEFSISQARAALLKANPQREQEKNDAKQ